LRIVRVIQPITQRLPFIRRLARFLRREEQSGSDERRKKQKHTNIISTPEHHPELSESPNLVAQMLQNRTPM
jgi:hypothetical protein